MPFAIDQKLKIFLETPQGQVFEMTSYVTALSIDNFANGPTRMTIDLIGLDPGTWTTKVDYQKKLQSNRSLSEWKCDYCRQVNLREHLFCQTCGAVRSFVYD